MIDVRAVSSAALVMSEVETAIREKLGSQSLGDLIAADVRAPAGSETRGDATPRRLSSL